MSSDGIIVMEGKIPEEGTVQSKLVEHTGGCHCGAVRFKVNAAENLVAYDCNCSICVKKQIKGFIVPESDFTLLQGADNITTYTYNTRQAQHTFCKTCGVESFYTPRLNPNGRSHVGDQGCELTEYLTDKMVAMTGPEVDKTDVIKTRHNLYHEEDHNNKHDMPFGWWGNEQADTLAAAPVGDELLYDKASGRKGPLGYR